MKNANWMALALTGALAAGCGGNKGDANGALDDVPDAQALTLEVTGSATEQAAVAQAPAAQAALAAAVTVSDWPVTGNDLTEGQRKIAAVNSALRAFIRHVEGVALVGGVPFGSGKWYGPADRCAVDVPVGNACPAGAAANFRLWVGRGPLGFAGAFLLQARPFGSTDAAAWKTVAAGKLARGALPRRGHGQIWLDLDNLKSVANPTDLDGGYEGQGKLLGGFAAGPLAKAETLLLEDFTPDATNPDWPPATVAFRGFKNAAGTARVRVAALKDYVKTTSDTELGLFHVVYNPLLGGRAFAIVADYTSDSVTHGDVPAGYYFFGRSCYAAGAPTTPIFKEWFLCPLTGAGAEAPAVCALDTNNPSTIEIGSPGDTWQSKCALAANPAEFDPPAATPGADPAQTPAPLPGESTASETPDAPPADTDPLPSAS